MSSYRASKLGEGGEAVSEGKAVNGRYCANVHTLANQSIATLPMTAFTGK